MAYCNVTKSRVSIDFVNYLHEISAENSVDLDLGNFMPSIDLKGGKKRYLLL